MAETRELQATDRYTISLTAKELLDLDVLLCAAENGTAHGPPWRTLATAARRAIRRQVRPDALLWEPGPR
jgi:hypothetical protein